MTKFGTTEPFTMGVEEEFQILDPETGELVARIDEVLGKAGPDLEENLQSELFQAIVETATDICHDIDELREEVVRLRGGLVDYTHGKGYAIGAAGTHPTARWEDNPYTDKERYEELIEELRWPAKRELIFGQHVHVAVPEAEQAIFVNNNLRPFLPLMLALSTNAPFWKGKDTGLKSCRVRIFDALPRTGMPRSFRNFADFQAAVDTFKAVGSIEDYTKIWYDIRPRPDLGTVELRIPDLPTETDLSVAIAALTQALVVRLCRAYENGEAPPLQHNYEVIQENRWRAMRDGIDAKLIQLTPAGGAEAIPMDQAWQSTKDILGDIPTELGLKREMATIEEVVQRRQTGADRQLEVYEETGDFTEVVRDLVDRTPP